jgi:hypothetical protein
MSEIRPEVEMIMTNMQYLSTLPKTVPAGLVIVHNQVVPSRQPGTRGSRCWLQPPSDRLEVCPCGWASELGDHFRVAATRPR